LFLLQLDNQLDIYGGPTEGTEYSLDGACPKCGTGAAQVGPLILLPFKLPKHEMFMTLDREVLVSTRVADLLRTHGFVCVRPVLKRGGQEPLPLAQLVPEATLPRFLPGSTGVTRERPCGVCDRDGYFGIPHVPMGLKYAPSASSATDLLATFERFGHSRLRTPFKESVFAAPMYVCSARLADFLSTQQLKGVSFEPVALTGAAQ
jgi:hypothetical protein